MKQKLIAIACLPVLLAACSFIPKSPGADRVLLLPLERVKSCTEVGQTKVQVLDRVGSSRGAGHRSIRICSAWPRTMPWTWVATPFPR